MPWLHVVLQPYVKSAELFHCPSDTGMLIEDFTGQYLGAEHSMYSKYGTSYCTAPRSPRRHSGDAFFQTPAQLNVYMDGSGLWHGSGKDDLTIGVDHFYETNSDLFRAPYQHPARRWACEKPDVYAGLGTLGYAAVNPPYIRTLIVVFFKLAQGFAHFGANMG